jgi:hypothetical protein
MNLKNLQEEVNSRWEIQENNPCHGSDPDHTLKHLMMALGEIARGLNSAEHEGRTLRPGEVDKYLADLVICAARLADNVVDLDAACGLRLTEKFPIPSRRWGIYDVEQKRWWPRRFAEQGEAQAHYNSCKGPGSRGEVRLMPRA